jgi:mono/diheme cytochrome c family protein
MPDRTVSSSALGVVAAFLTVLFQPAHAGTEPDDLIKRGKYLLHAGGCISCHTAKGDDAIPLAGGRALETPFGTFYPPNITPDDETGIGKWSDEDFLNALQLGVRPDGSRYFPAFPYTSYSGARKEDLLAIKAYLFSVEPVRSPDKGNELDWYLSSRLAARAWQIMNFQPERFEEDPEQGQDWNRGAYLVRHLGHCGECHTPRSITGQSILDQALTGTASGANGKKVPNISQDRENGIGRWSIGEIELFLEMGLLPDGDFTGSEMSQVIDDNTSFLTAEDRRAIAVYLKSLTGPQDPR